jgi:hypothetical protein
MSITAQSIEARVEEEKKESRERYAAAKTKLHHHPRATSSF